ncbi:hypothetical protein HMPREF3181_01543 [Parvimonas sp. KA00067]|uniref:hypothetical protein n=1 Tax=Parvimonas sp. KA00067 TaxID=1588755 RepID=UPI00079135B5|nr:hypothetical protein [Parvimonas sp. KA00067]KXB64415.1 hypothetical protein HMPREF3181_01543 [Parvimonas sp. KA00067]
MEENFFKIRNNIKNIEDIIYKLGVNIVYIFLAFYSLIIFVFEESIINFISIIIIIIVLFFVFLSAESCEKISRIVGAYIPLILSILIMYIDIYRFYKKYKFSNIVEYSLKEFFMISIILILLVLPTYLLNRYKILKIVSLYRSEISFGSLFGNIFRLVLFISIFISIYIEEDIRLIYYLVVLVTMISVTEFIIYLELYLKIQNLKKPFKKWNKIDYLGLYYEIKQIKGFNYGCSIFENHSMLKKIEKKILKKFKTKDDLSREIYLVSKKEYIFNKYQLIPPILSFFTPFLKSVNFEKISYILKNTMSSNISNDNTINNNIELFFIFILIFMFFVLLFSIYIDNRNYLKLLNRLFDDYESLFKKHNIKRICISNNLDEEDKKYLEVVFIEYHKTLINIENFKKLLNFLESNGIQVIFYCKEDNVLKNIMKNNLKNKIEEIDFNNSDYIFIEKNDVQNYDEKEDFIFRLSDELCISKDEYFAVLKKENEKVEIDMNLIEDENIKKYEKSFNDIDKFIEFLKFKME